MAKGPKSAPSSKPALKQQSESESQKIERLSKLPAQEIINRYTKIKTAENTALLLEQKFNRDMMRKKAELTKAENEGLKDRINNEIDTLLDLIKKQRKIQVQLKKPKKILIDAYHKKTGKGIEDALKKTEKKKPAQKPSTQSEKTKKQPPKKASLKTEWEAVLKKNPHIISATNKTLHTTLQAIKALAPQYATQMTTLTKTLNTQFDPLAKKITGKTPTERKKQYDELIKKDPAAVRALIRFHNLAIFLQEAKNSIKRNKQKPQLINNALTSLIQGINSNKSITVIKQAFNNAIQEKKPQISRRPGQTPKQQVELAKQKKTDALKRLRKAQTIVNKLKQALGNSNEHHIAPLQKWLTEVNTDLIGAQDNTANINQASDAANRVCDMVDKISRSNKSQIIPALKALNGSLSLIDRSSNLGQAMDALSKFYKENPAIPAKHRMWVALIGAAAKRFPGIADGVRTVMIFMERYPLVKQWFDAVFGEGVKSALVKIAYGDHYQDRTRMVKHIESLASQFNSDKRVLYGTIRYNTLNPLFRAYAKKGYRPLNKSEMADAIEKNASSWQKIRNKRFLKKFDLSNANTLRYVNNILAGYANRFRSQQSNRQSYLLQLGSYSMLKALFPAQIQSKPSTQKPAKKK